MVASLYIVFVLVFCFFSCRAPPAPKTAHKLRKHKQLCWHVCGPPQNTKKHTHEKHTTTETPRLTCAPPGPKNYTTQYRHAHHPPQKQARIGGSWGRFCPHPVSYNGWPIVQKMRRALSIHHAPLNWDNYQQVILQYGIVLFCWFLRE